MLTKTQRIQTRYYPPGINIIYSQASLESAIQNSLEKQLNLYNLYPSQFQQFGKKILAYPATEVSLRSKIDSLIDGLINQCVDTITDLKYHRDKLQEALLKIINKHNHLKYYIDKNGYKLRKTIKVHVQPLTNCLFNKNGDKFATASYDRTCRIWQSSTGNLLASIKGHRNAVFCLDFSRFSDKQLIATGSLDHTARLSTIQGVNLSNFKDHQGEITSVKFNPNGIHLATSSFDQTVKIWDIQKGKRILTLSGHTGEVIKIDHTYNGQQLLSGSFDNTAKIWDMKTGEMVRNLFGHTAEVNTCKFQYTGQMCASGSNDNSCILWDVGLGKKIQKFQDHSAEIYDLDFSKRGDYLATSSGDCTLNIYNINTSACLHSLKGHKGEITRGIFTNDGTSLLSTGYDGIGRIWDVKTGNNIGLLEGHEQQIFSCDIDYEGQRIITCSKDNVCNVWQLQRQPEQ